MNKELPISFESHIIDDVFDKMGGRYTKKQIRDVFRASISYAYDLCKYTDNVSVSFPYIGDMVCNVREMRCRKHNLERLKSKGMILRPNQIRELEALTKKIADIEEAKADGRIARGDILWKNNKCYSTTYNGVSYADAQRAQEEEFRR